MEPVPAWSKDEATRIAAAAEGWMHEHQPPGYSPTPEESQRMAILHSRLQEAERRKDMEAWQQIHMSLLCLAMASYRRFAGWGSEGDVMDQHENMQELLTRLNNIRDSMEAALGDIKGIEDDYRRGLLEAHIRGAIREINAQITELVSSRKR
jgi:hypothetical protein